LRFPTADIAYSIALEGTLSPEDERLIDEGLAAYGAQFAPQGTSQPFIVMVRPPAGRLVGGLIAETEWAWLYVRTLWSEEAARRHGCGRRLMNIAEKEALQRGCHSARLATQSYEALPFYKHLGYRVFGGLSDYPRGHKKYFLEKRLG
jgi:GNAT superfamily N-acetyltransferase